MKKTLTLFFLGMCMLWIHAQTPAASFTVAAGTFSEGRLKVKLTSTSTGTPLSYVWSFPDGNPIVSSTTIADPIVTYASPGTYTAQLIVNYSTGPSTTSTTFTITGGTVIDLSSGRNDNGTLMAIDVPDSDWKINLSPTGNEQITSYTRHTYTGWSDATIDGVGQNSIWITNPPNWPYTITDFYYTSKSFEIPAGTTGLLNLRSLSFVRNWTYLVDENTGTETEITKTTFMRDGAKGWLNSRSPEVVNKVLSPGKYHIKTRVYSASTTVRQSLNVNANVRYGSSVVVAPSCEQPVKPVIGTITQPTSCSVTTGSVELNSLPSGNWTVIANPGGAALSGNTTTATFANIAPGTYTFKVTSSGCSSPPSNEVVIKPFMTIDGKDEVCQGSATTFTVSRGLQGTWSIVPPVSAGAQIIQDTTTPYSAKFQTASTPVITMPTSIIIKFTATDGCVYTKNVIISKNVTAAFNIPRSICFGENYALPTIAENTIIVNGVSTPITGTWFPPVVDNTVATEYFFIPNRISGYCISTPNRIINVTNSLERYSGDNYQRVTVGTSIHNIFYRIKGTTTGIQITWDTGSTPPGLTAKVNGAEYQITGTPTSVGTYNYTITTPASNNCPSGTAIGKIIVIPANTPDWTLAPNSYIFDTSWTKEGIKIPVAKAYAMWKDNRDPLISFNKPIPTERILSAYVYWEDVSGLIKSDNSYRLTLEGTGEIAKILVPIDKAKGEGNAVIALHAGATGSQTDPIAWTWHVWVTDDPTNGSTFNQSYNPTRAGGTMEKNKNGQDVVTNGNTKEWQWMDRNLGATNAHFLGTDWHKSAGLMYQWGRKDAFPPMTYKDGTRYEINGEIGENPFFNPFAPVNDHPFAFGWRLRPNNRPNDHSDVVENLKYTVTHPLQLITYINSSDETWFSDQEYRVFGRMNGAVESTRISWDLWSDNRNGMFSQASSSNREIVEDSKTYELKSPHDPCPCGWRIPSHYGGSIATENHLSPWGRFNSGGTDATTFNLNTPDVYLGNVKIYPSLGFDFSKQTGNSNAQLNRQLGYFPITGGYVYVGPNEGADYIRESEGVNYINWLSTTGLPTSTYSPWNGIRDMGIVADYKDKPDLLTLKFSVFSVPKTKGAGPVRCIKDPNDSFMPTEFKTEFIPALPSNYSIETLKIWSKAPNSYIILPHEESKTFNISKAIAMHEMYLTDNQPFPTNLSVRVFWTTNTNLIQASYIPGTPIELGNININRTPGQFGNAVVALYNNATSSVIWSWHVWVPETEPVPITEYQTENPYDANGISPSGQVINNTWNLISPPLKTTFMDRNLGALQAFSSETSTADFTKTIGLHYQWGRKDPLPTFRDGDIFIDNGTRITATDFNSRFISNFSQYASNIVPTDKRYQDVMKVLNWSVANPLTYMNQNNTISDSRGGVRPKDWISTERGIAYERWGHATEKSPFDPCPEGWRIPDTFYSFTYSNTADSGVKGTSPWYLGGEKITDPNSSFKGISQIWDASASNDYKGTLISNMGWIFDGENNGKSYIIGNYPFAGIRTNNSVSSDNIGVWSASMNDNKDGRGIGLIISSSGKMKTGEALEPYLAMSCRCAKIQTDENGNELGVYNPQTVSFEPPVSDDLNDITLYPNPVYDIINIANDGDFNYEIHSFHGALLKTGHADNKQINVSHLSPGTYFIKLIDTATQKVYVNKIIKV